MPDYTALSRKSGISIPVLWKITFQRATKHSNSIFFLLTFSKRGHIMFLQIVLLFAPLTALGK